MEKEAGLSQTVDIDTNERDLDALNAWLDGMIANLEQKCPDAPTYLVQARCLKDVFLEVRIESKKMNLNPTQMQLLVLFLNLVLWALNLSICATVASDLEQKKPAISLKLVDLSNHLFEHFILLRDSLTCLLLARFESFDDIYANIKVYSNIKSFISFYRSYCLRFDDEFKPKKGIEEGRWVEIQDFLRILGNKSGHEYDQHSKQTINLKKFNDLLEIDYEADLEHHSKIGNKVHKYPLAILVLFRFLLKDQSVGFDEINKKWFSCDGKFFDNFGNVTKIEEVKSLKV
jgi:hypothetical protein